MNIAILSCNTGGGHNSAAAAIARELDAQGHTYKIYNTLDFLPPSSARLISRGHDFAYRHAPKLYGAGYRYEEKHPPVLLYEQCGKGCLPLWEALTEQGAQAVICVHVFPAMMMTELSGRGLYLPSYFVATDYTCSPGVSELVVDGICIPHPLLAEEFAAAGLPADRLYPTGIPVSPEFAPAADREAVRVKLHMVGRSHVLVLACGSMGAGPLRGAAEVIRQQLGEDDLLVVVCGSNRRLYRQCRTAFMDDPRVRVLGYMKRMAQFLQAADLLITKAGGLTTTEAVAAGVPIFYLDAIPGCESRNIDFMTRHGYALAIRAEEELPALLQGCLSGALDPTAMVRRRSETFPRHAAANIVKLLSE